MELIINLLKLRYSPGGPWFLSDVMLQIKMGELSQIETSEQLDEQLFGDILSLPGRYIPEDATSFLYFQNTGDHWATWKHL